MKSSLTYQLLLYLGCYYFTCFLLLEMVLLLYKSIILPFPPGNLVAEVRQDFSKLYYICHQNLLS